MGYSSTGIFEGVCFGSNILRTNQLLIRNCNNKYGRFGGTLYIVFNFYFRFYNFVLKFIVMFCFYIFTQYLSGFGNEFSSEALKNALPKGQVCKFFVYDCAISHVVENFKNIMILSSLPS